MKFVGFGVAGFGIFQIVEIPVRSDIGPPFIGEYPVIYVGGVSGDDCCQYWEFGINCGRGLVVVQQRLRSRVSQQGLIEAGTVKILYVIFPDIGILNGIE